MASSHSTAFVSTDRSKHASGPSPWGNPFSHLDGTLAEYRVATRREAVWAYARWLLDQPHLLERLGELRDHRLVCWCHPASCHGHVLAFACDHGIEALRARVAGHHYPD